MVDNRKLNVKVQWRRVRKCFPSWELHHASHQTEKCIGRKSLVCVRHLVRFSIFLEAFGEAHRELHQALKDPTDLGSQDMKLKGLDSLNWCWTDEVSFWVLLGDVCLTLLMRNSLFCGSMTGWWMDADRHKWPMARQGFAQIGWLWLLSEDERFSTLPGLPAGRRVANLETKLLKALFVSFVTSSRFVALEQICTWTRQFC